MNVETNSTDGVWLTLSGGGKFTFRQNTLRLTGGNRTSCLRLARVWHTHCVCVCFSAAALSVAGNTTVVQDCDMFLSVPTGTHANATTPGDPTKRPDPET